METFQTTIKALFEALEKNGFEHLRGAWFRSNYDSVIVGGCVLGQAAINLGAYQPNTGFPNISEAEGTLLHELNKFKQTAGKWEIENSVGQGYGNLVDGCPTVGQQIMSWNDSGKYGGPNNDFEYNLPTWPEVVEMARDCLTPYFNEVITLQKHEWDARPLNV